jgi:hypothetical protein
MPLGEVANRVLYFNQNLEERWHGINDVISVFSWVAILFDVFPSKWSRPPKWYSCTPPTRRWYMIGQDAEHTEYCSRYGNSINSVFFHATEEPILTCDLLDEVGKRRRSRLRGYCEGSLCLCLSPVICCWGCRSQNDTLLRYSSYSRYKVSFVSLDVSLRWPH